MLKGIFFLFFGGMFMVSGNESEVFLSNVSDVEGLIKAFQFF